MSVEAITWAFAQTTDGPGPKLVLIALANRADDSGVTWAGQETMAGDCSMSVRAVRDNMKRLEAAGMLARIQRFRKNGSRTSDWIVLAPGVEDRGTLRESSDSFEKDAPDVAALTSPARQNPPEAESDGDHRQIPGGPEPSGEPSGEPSSSERHLFSLAFSQVSESVGADSFALMKAKVKVDGRLVMPLEMEKAAVALSVFNREADSEFGLGAHLRPIVMRLRERPSLTPEQMVRLVESAWRIRWWERKGKGRRATPAVVFGNAGCFENVVQDAVQEAKGETPNGGPAEPDDPYTRND